MIIIYIKVVVDVILKTHKKTKSDHIWALGYYTRHFSQTSKLTRSIFFHDMRKLQAFQRMYFLMFKYGHADLLRLFKQFQSANVIQNDMQKKLEDLYYTFDNYIWQFQNLGACFWKRVINIKTRSRLEIAACNINLSKMAYVSTKFQKTLLTNT